MFKTPLLLQKLLPSFLWRVPATEKVIYLTFDDGPIPEVTEFVLKQLAQYKAKATFFCVGDNIRKHPEIFKRLLASGHRVGNHTFNHLKGWETDDADYLENVVLWEQEALLHVPELFDKQKKLFRPPYGKVGIRQARQLHKKNVQIVMWDVLTKDYDASLDAENCLAKAIKNTQKGSIVLFHDSLKAEKNLRFALPAFLEYFNQKGYRFDAL